MECARKKEKNKHFYGKNARGLAYMENFSYLCTRNQNLIIHETTLIYSHRFIGGDGDAGESAKFRAGDLQGSDRACDHRGNEQRVLRPELALDDRSRRDLQFPDLECA